MIPKSSSKLPGSSAKSTEEKSLNRPLVGRGKVVCGGKTSIHGNVGGPRMLDCSDLKPRALTKSKGLLVHK